MKPKLLCILHRSPPAHGAAKVGDYIASMPSLQEQFECKFITIRSSNTIGDIGKVNPKKLFYALDLYIKIILTLLFFRPNKIYFTASFQSVALYRDLIACSLWKIFKLFKRIDIFYHYHTKGINSFVSKSKVNLHLTRYFIRGVNLILLSPILENDFNQVKTYKHIYYLPNSVESPQLKTNHQTYLSDKHMKMDTIQILYLAHMIKEKGYWEVLELANQSKTKNLMFHFAGLWQDKKSETEFFNFIKENQLEDQVTYHGYVTGEEKASLFRNAHVLLYPSKNDAFPLTILESFSYGVPVISTNEGSIPSIINDQCGIILKDTYQLNASLNESIEKLINPQTSEYCYQRYLKNYSMKKFEDNLLDTLNA